MSKIKGFTLIELLIVVAIIAILAAIAVPNFLEAQTRSKVTRVKADMRTVATCLESYYVDNNAYPPEGDPNGGPPCQVVGICPDSQYPLIRITTPIAYCTSVDGTTTDPFMENMQAYNAADDVYSELNNFFYVNYEHFAQLRVGPADPYTSSAWGLSSLGPDTDDDGVTWAPYLIAGNPAYWLNGPNNALTMIYDPSNGTVSGGDLVRFGGAIDGTVEGFLKD